MHAVFPIKAATLEEQQMTKIEAAIQELRDTLSRGIKRSKQRVERAAAELREIQNRMKGSDS